MGKVTSIRLDDDVVEIWEALDRGKRSRLVNELIRDQGMQIEGYHALIEALRNKARLLARVGRKYDMGICRTCGYDYSISRATPTQCRDCFHRTQTKLELE